MGLRQNPSSRTLRAPTCELTLLTCFKLQRAESIACSTELLNFSASTKKVITVEITGQGRCVKLRDKLSRSAIAKASGLSRATVKTWLKGPWRVS